VGSKFLGAFTKFAKSDDYIRHVYPSVRPRGTIRLTHGECS